MFWVPLVFAIGLAEAYRVQIGWAPPKSENFYQLYEDDQYKPGDLGFDPLGLYPTDPKEQYDLQVCRILSPRCEQTLSVTLIIIF